MGCSPANGPCGFSLVELAVALTILGTLGTVVVASGTVDRVHLSMGSRIVESQLLHARLHAASTHVSTRVTLDNGQLRVVTADSVALATVRLVGPGTGLDSARIRPATLRFNTRGHGGLGSVFLYKGDRGVRIVSNMVGRLRKEAVK